MDEQNFNVYSWSSGIPLCDDVWLGMQLRNIAIVDFGFIRPIEREAIARFVANDKIGMDVLIPLSAISQMWVSSLYEFLRTWRQRADLIIKVSDKYDALPDRDRAEYLAAEVAKAEGRESFVKRAPTFVSEQVGCISQAGFADGVRAYKEHTEGLFRSIESLRVTLAKHEVPKTKGFAAEAPGYGRVDMLTGSMYWHFATKEGYLDRVDRREVANAFYGLPSEHADFEDDDLPEA